MKKRMTAILISASAAILLLILEIKSGIEAKKVSSIGIIGAADGPTSIFVTSRVNGNLFLALGIAMVLVVAVLCVTYYRKGHKA